MMSFFNSTTSSLIAPMIRKLPPWIELGAFLLALNAGFTNATGLLGFEHQAISHVSGSASYFSLALVTGEGVRAIHLLWVLLSFMLGAAISGWVVQYDALKLGRRYGAVLLIESLFLFFAFYFLLHGSFIGHYFASAACGLQNAMTTHYSGAIIRTTHLSGVFTDLGIMLGQRLRGIPFDKRKAALFFFLIFGFVLGGILGYQSFVRWQIASLIIAATYTLVLAVAYHFYARHRTHMH